MSVPKLINPLLDNFAMGTPMGEHDGVRCCPAMQAGSDDKYIVKIISIPASQVRLQALLLSGAYATPSSALAYFKELSDGVVAEAAILQRLSSLEGFLPYKGWQVVPMENEVGYDVYLLGSYKRSLEKILRKQSLTHLAAINLALDMCAALAVCRRAGYLYVDLKPQNIFMSEDNEYRIGDLGFVPLNSLKYATLPDRYRSSYTAPELRDAYASLNSTVDIYALGLVLYQVYNNGQLPFSGNAPAEALPAPLFADYEMADIIMKALAPNPIDRWQDPIQMGQAIVSYMQRNGANDTPIVRTKEPSVDEDAVGSYESTLPKTDPLSEEDISSIGELISSDDGSDEEAPMTDEDAEADLEDDYLDDETAPSEEMLQGLSETSMTEDTTQMLAQAEELIALPSLEPVVAPEPIELKIPKPIEVAPKEPVAEKPAETELPTETDEPVETIESPAPEEAEKPAGEAAPIRRRRSVSDAEEESEPRRRTRRSRKKRHSFGWIAALIVLAVLAWGGYYYYQNIYTQSINALEIIPQIDSVTVRVDSAVADSALTIVCTDTYGNAQTANVANKQATFRNLLPATLYKFEVQMSGFHKLTGQKTGTWTTPMQTNIVSFSGIVGPEDGSVILSFTADGSDPEEWVVTYSAEGEDELALTFKGHSVTVYGLAVGKEYTFRLGLNGDTVLTGETEYRYEAVNVVYAQDLTVTGVEGDAVTVSWVAPEDAGEVMWSVQCTNENGFSETLNTTGTGAVFTGLDFSVPHTFEVIASGMTQGIRTTVSANPVTVNSIDVDTSDPNCLTLRWDFAGNAPENGWLVFFTMDSSENPEVVKCDTNEARIWPRLPYTDYTFSVRPNDDLTFFGGERSFTTGGVYEFANYGVLTSAFYYHFIDTPDLSDEDFQPDELGSDDYRDAFAVGQPITMMVHLAWPYLEENETIAVMTVIRDSDGRLVSVESEDYNWNTMWRTWNNRYLLLDVPDTVSEPGDYTWELYFNGAYCTTRSFTIYE